MLRGNQDYENGTVSSAFSMELAGLEPATSWVRFRPEGTNRHQREMSAVGRVVHCRLLPVSLCQSCAKDRKLGSGGLGLGEQGVRLRECWLVAHRGEQRSRLGKPFPSRGIAESTETATLA